MDKLSLKHTDLILPKVMKAGPVFIHADIKRALHLVDRRQDITGILEQFVDVCKQIADGRDIWMPVFSYRFTNDGIFNIQEDTSDIGALSEYFRKQAAWRTNEPIFSVAGLENTKCPQILNLPHVNKLKAFGPNSIFAKLIENDGIIVWLGASLKNNVTFVHYAESLFGVPLYRYLKTFKGSIIDNNNSYDIELEYHVKPKQFRISYDYDIRMAAVAKGIIKEFPGTKGTCYYCYANELVDYFSEFLSKDPLSLLDKDSLNWVTFHLEKLGRGFVQSDFENL